LLHFSPDWYFTGRGKAKKIAEFPKTIEIEISDEAIMHSEKTLKEYKLAKAVFCNIEEL